MPLRVKHLDFECTIKELPARFCIINVFNSPNRFSLRIASCAAGIPNRLPSPSASRATG